MKLYSNKLIGLKKCLLIFSMSSLLLISSCTYASNNVMKAHGIGYKATDANYGEYTVYYDGKIYFQYLSDIYCINPENDIVSALVKLNLSGQMFSIDNGRIYFAREESTGNTNIYSTDFSGKNMIIEANHKYFISNRALSSQTEQFYVRDGIVYDLKNMSYFKNKTELISFSIPNDAEQTVVSGSKSELNLYQSNDAIYFQYDLTRTVKVFYKENNNFMPFGYYSPYVLSYDKNSNSTYFFNNDEIFVIKDGQSSKIADLNCMPLSPVLYYFAEDTNNQYFVVGDSIAKGDESCYAVNKSTGNVQLIYTTEKDEQIFSLTPQYVIVYKKGSIYKILNSDSTKTESIKLFTDNSIQYNIDTEQCDRYLYAEKNGSLKIIDLDKMKELRVKVENSKVSSAK